MNDLKPGELKIYYDDLLNTALDKALEKVLKGFGYRRWASGVDLTTGVRDLAFDKKER